MLLILLMSNLVGFVCATLEVTEINDDNTETPLEKIEIQPTIETQSKNIVQLLMQMHLSESVIDRENCIDRINTIIGDDNFDRTALITRVRTAINTETIQKSVYMSPFDYAWSMIQEASRESFSKFNIRKLREAKIEIQENLKSVPNKIKNVWKRFRRRKILPESDYEESSTPENQIVPYNKKIRSKD